MPVELTGQTGRPVRNHPLGHGKDGARGPVDSTWPGQVADHHPGCAAQASPGLLRPAPGAQAGGGPPGAESAKTGAVDGNAARNAGRGAAGAAVFAVHQHARLDRGGAAGSAACLGSNSPAKAKSATSSSSASPAAEVPLFLISLKAGGVGLNLPQADTVIHYDPWWNPRCRGPGHRPRPPHWPDAEPVGGKNGGPGHH
jgi:hypothetical protein